MQSGLTDALDDVDADPAAVFEAHDADTVDELVAGDPELTTGEADDVDALFADGIETPARERTDERAATASAPQGADDVFSELERAAGSPVAERPAEATEPPSDAREPADPDSEATDDEVEAALAAAEDVYEGDLPDEIPFE